MTERQLRDMQVQAQDAAYAHKQLRSVLDERDSLDVQLRQLRSSQHMGKCVTHRCVPWSLRPKCVHVVHVRT